MDTFHDLSPAAKGLLAGLIMSIWVGPLIGIGAALVVARAASKASNRSKSVDGGPRPHL